MYVQCVSFGRAISTDFFFVHFAIVFFVVVMRVVAV